MPACDISFRGTIRCCGKKFSTEQEAINCEEKHDKEKAEKLALRLHKESAPHDERYCSGQCIPHYLRVAQEIIDLLAKFDKER